MFKRGFKWNHVEPAASCLITVKLNVSEPNHDLDGWKPVSNTKAIFNKSYQQSKGKISTNRAINIGTKNCRLGRQGTGKNLGEIVGRYLPHQKVLFYSGAYAILNSQAAFTGIIIIKCHIPSWEHGSPHFPFRWICSNCSDFWGKSGANFRCLLSLELKGFFFFGCHPNLEIPIYTTI